MLFSLPKGGSNGAAMNRIGRDFLSLVTPEQTGAKPESQNPSRKTETSPAVMSGEKPGFSPLSAQFDVSTG
jgi:hypothetical protein